MSVEGGEVIGYYDKQTLKKIHCIFYGEMGKTEEDYYVNGNGLYFLYRKETFYDKPMYLKDSKVKNTFGTRYYLYDHKLIKAIVRPNASTALSNNKIVGRHKEVLDMLNTK